MVNFLNSVVGIFNLRESEPFRWDMDQSRSELRLIVISVTGGLGVTFPGKKRSQHLNDTLIETSK